MPEPSHTPTLSRPLDLILASASPARTKLLTDAGIAHRIQVSDVDEDAVVARHGVTDPAETALLLARAKAEAVAATLAEKANEPGPGALVLGCDSVFSFDGVAYGKPYTPARATERITAMSGRSGVLYTGHWLIDTRPERVTGTDAGSDAAPGGAAAGAIASAEVHFATMTDAEIAAYVATGEPLTVAGSFTIDSRGSAFIRRVDGDPHAVIGLSVTTLRTLLGRLGEDITTLWA
ncbi:nucleoside triphosphate pyrophosphatase [Tersicoccus sp. Bi-70]|uniref:Maf family protein n=1 Tax=Tersicoccus sp. Bi-70 TaxID=1897634 RepID=UPI0009783DB2|nr:nucleoside triphosphate pyrophosphatase [Tersicoccus sp. Bi-70]OMH31343.1 septum formation protein Maf [Tersicoccus sp. Bi-70]